MNEEKMTNSVAKLAAIKLKGLSIVAKQGKNVYLLADKEGKVGRILSITQKKLFKPNNFQSILARGYWEEYNGTDKELASLLAQVEDEDEEGN